MIGQEKMIGYTEVRTKHLQPVVVEQLCIVKDNYHWDPKLAYDVFPNKVLGIFFSDFGKGFRPYPFRKVIYGDKQKSLL